MAGPTRDHEQPGSSRIRRRVVAHGRVQGVFFRASCRREARRRGVDGWASNRADGTVEAVFEGEPTAVAALVAWTRQGPPGASVRRVDVTEEDPRRRARLRDPLVRRPHAR